MDRVTRRVLRLRQHGHTGHSEPGPQLLLVHLRTTGQSSLRVKPHAIPTHPILITLPVIGAFVVFVLFPRIRRHEEEQQKR